VSAAPERHRKVVDLAALVAIRRRLREEGKILVQCHGCFDIVHPGHLRYLRFAREQGDCLVVSVTADEFVGKGHDRPYIDETLRAENLAELEVVDWVVVDRNAWAGPVLEAVQPDVYVKGKEYETGGDPRFARERELVESYGGAVIFSSGEVVYSSSAILDQFRDRFRLEGDKIRAFCRRHAIERAGLEEVIRRFSGLPVLVVGDPIVDRYVHCEVAHVAAESPILDAHAVAEEQYLGAAALIARQLAAFGARPTLLTSFADSPHRAAFLAGLEESGVAAEVVEDTQRPIYVKTRYLADGAKVFKVNHGRYAPLSSVADREMRGRLETLAADHAAVVVTDFGYGLFSSGMVELVSSLPGRGVPYFLDVSQISAARLLAFRGATCATPTETEIRLAFADREAGLSNLAARFYRQTHAQRLIITLGPRGAVLFHPPEEGARRLETDYLPALVARPVDAVGAGDVFLATTSLAALAGAGAAQGLFLAMSAAGLHVERLGNDPVDLPDLVRFLTGHPFLV
jgi:rfaE bifunctional protein kinase chain/domain/rfaE bifunctional protein nucleotidyltransferase chain/domain